MVGSVKLVRFVGDRMPSTKEDRKRDRYSKKNWRSTARRQKHANREYA